MIVGLLMACSGPPSSTPADLVVAPSSGAPGSVMTLSGIAFLPEDTYEVWVGDRLAPSRLNLDGTLAAAVPLFLGTDAWPAPPGEPLDVEVRRAGEVLARFSGFAVEELPRASGATRDIQQAFSDIVAAYEGLFSALPATLPEEASLREAVIAMLDALIREGENSLEAVLSGSAPALEGAAVDTELLDAVLASSGARDYLLEYAGALRAASLDAQLELRAQALDFCDGEGEDLELACQMQIHVVLDDFSRTFVKPSATTYANTVGLALGVVGIYGANGVALSANVIIGALLGVADFVMEKVAPALFPSRITQFELKLPDPTIDVDEVTESQLFVTAANDPPQITYLDIAEQVYALIGLKDVNAQRFGGVAGLQDAVVNTAKFVLEQYVKVAKAAEAQKPGTHPWVTAGDIRIPNMAWGPVEMTSDRLVQLFSYDEGIVQPLEEELEWQGVSLGEATVRAMPRGPGSKSKVLIDNALCFGCVYYGAAFGNEMPMAQTNVVVGRLVLAATPESGAAPFATTFSWTGLPDQGEPVTCTLDAGDGSSPHTIQDCANDTSLVHGYAYGSALKTASGSYRATLGVVGADVEAATDVFVDWTFTATPAAGEAPLDVTFAWSGFDPDLGALGCELDVGDGSPAQSVADCSTIVAATHRYPDAGTFVPSLTVRGALGETLKTVQVTVADGACDPSQEACSSFALAYTHEEGNESASGNVRYSLVRATHLLDGKVHTYDSARLYYLAEGSGTYIGVNGSGDGVNDEVCVGSWSGSWTELVTARLLEDEYGDGTLEVTFNLHGAEEGSLAVTLSACDTLENTWGLYRPWTDYGSYSLLFPPGAVVAEASQDDVYLDRAIRVDLGGLLPNR